MPFLSFTAKDAVLLLYSAELARDQKHQVLLVTSTTTEETLRGLYSQNVEVRYRQNYLICGLLE